MSFLLINIKKLANTNISISYNINKCVCEEWGVKLKWNENLHKFIFLTNLSRSNNCE